MIIAGGQDISTLECLREVSEDIIDNKDSLDGIGWACDVWKYTVSASIS
jgi:hypothetical protein